MAFADLPDLSNDRLTEWSGFAKVREGRTLAREAKFNGLEWKHPILRAELVLDSRSFSVELNLQSLTFVRNHCDCAEGKRGVVCAHAVALCLAAREQSVREAEGDGRGESQSLAAETDALTSDETPETPSMKFFKQDPMAGTTLRFRWILPPNYEDAIKRKVLLVKLEAVIDRHPTAPERVFRGKPYDIPEGDVRLGAYLENLCGGKLFGLLQLTHTQCAEALRIWGDDRWVYLKSDSPRPQSAEWIDEHLLKPLGMEEKETTVSPRRSNAAKGRAKSHSIPLSKSSAVERWKARQNQKVTIPDGRIVVDGSPHFISIQPPPKDHDFYSKVIAFLREQQFRSEPSNGKWWLRDSHRVLNFIAAQLPSFVTTYDPVFTENYTTRTALIQRVEPECKVEGEDGDYSVEIRINAEGVPDSAFFEAVRSNQYYVKTPENIFLLPPESLEKVRLIREKLESSNEGTFSPVYRTKLKAPQLVDAESILEEFDEDIVLPEQWKARSSALKHLQSLQLPPIPPELDQLLRQYQRIGVAWMYHLFTNDLGGVLADEMGLGKTIQALGLIASANEKEGKGTTLVVAPASLVENWAREARRFVPHLKVFSHHRESRIEEVGAFGDWDIVVTTYATLTRDADLFQGFEFRLVIADEAQHVKNRRTQAAKTLRLLQSRGRFMLTGTPIENSVDDLRSIFDFCLPGYLRRSRDSIRGEEKKWLEDRHLEQAAPYILRRSKSLVAPELPEKLEQVLYCEMDARQREVYQSVQRKSEENLYKLESSGASENKVRFALLTELLRLRQVCADPGLVEKEWAIEDGAKFQAFQEILNESIDGDHRILVFSQFVQALKRVREFLKAEDIPFCYLDGQTTHRLAEVDRFNEDPTIPVFLISLKAGGTGLNLTGADTVIHLDPWWNPAAEAQATDRAHRIGQTRKVTSYKFIVSGTVEERVLALQQKKAELLESLFSASEEHTSKIDLDDLKSLLRGEAD